MIYSIAKYIHRYPLGTFMAMFRASNSLNCLQERDQVSEELAEEVRDEGLSFMKFTESWYMLNHTDTDGSIVHFEPILHLYSWQDKEQ